MQEVVGSSPTVSTTTGIQCGFLFFIAFMRPVVETIPLGKRSADVLRLDKMTAFGVGNKYYKLKYNIVAARQQGADTLLSFGGAFSNHIQALSAIGKQSGFRTIGVIRGEDDMRNPTLNFARQQGMHLHFVDRSTYRNKASAAFIEQLQKEYGDFYLLPEGGSNALAVKGTAEILEGLTDPYDIIMVACGTGATMAGIVQAAPPKSHVIGVSVLKGDDRLTQAVAAYLSPEKTYAKWNITFNYHLGGYAKRSPELDAFMHRLQTQTNLATDPIYTSKMVYAAHDMIEKETIPAAARLLLVHTGGMQGWEGWRYRFGMG